MIVLRINPRGRIRGLYDDTLALHTIGTLRLRRASHVEFDHHRQCWCVWSACGAQDPVCSGELSAESAPAVLYATRSRQAALDWERRHFQPGSPGWPEQFS